MRAAAFDGGFQLRKCFSATALSAGSVILPMAERKSALVTPDLRESARNSANGGDAAI